MGKVSYDVCDRCEKELKYPLFKITRIKTLHLWGGEYDYLNNEYDLCEPCGKLLESFMKGVKEETDGQLGNQSEGK